MANNTTVYDDMVQTSRLYFGFLNIIVCSFGILGNGLSVIIWSSFKKQSSTNALLIALAGADITSLLFYLIFAAYFFLITEPYQSYGHSKSGMYLVLICFHGFIVFSNMSNWFTIALGMFRYFIVCRVFISKTVCTLKHAKITIFVLFLFSAISLIPFYFYYEVNGEHHNSAKYIENNSYWIQLTEFAKSHSSYQTTILWLFGVFTKLVPSFVLIILSYRMIIALLEAKRRRQEIGGDQQNYKNTTIMLLVILFIFVINQLTIGVSAFISGLTDSGESHFFYFLIYSNVSDILDLTTLLNSALNFFVYISINTSFREKAFKIVKSVFIRKNSTNHAANNWPESRSSDIERNDTNRNISVLNE